MNRRTRAILIGILSVLIGLIANVLTAGVALGLLAQPVGARVRPMGEAVALVYGALVGVCGGALSLVAVRQEGTRRAGITGLALAVLPFPLGIVLMRLVIQLRHLVLLP